jgi:hypothetical protein
MKLLAQQIDLLTPAKEQGVGIVQAGSDVSNSGALFGNFVSSILQGIMVIAILMVLIFFVWGSIEWITSAGEKSKVESARNKITGAIIGLIVLASTLAVLFLVQNFLGVQVFSSSQKSFTPVNQNIQEDFQAPPIQRGQPF